MFNDDQQILHFMANTDIFKDAVIDEDENKCYLQVEASNMKGHIITKDVTSSHKVWHH